MPNTTVLVAAQPRLVRELILTVLQDARGIEVVGEVIDGTLLREMIKRTHPDFLLVTLGKTGRRPKVCDAALEEFPELTILAIAPERDQSVMYWEESGIHFAPVESSEHGILEILRMGREACSAHAAWHGRKAS